MIQLIQKENTIKLIKYIRQIVYQIIQYNTTSIFPQRGTGDQTYHSNQISGGPTNDIWHTE